MASLSNRQRATLIGILILLAYSMLTYSFSEIILLGVITDIVSGLAVIGIPILLFPIYNTEKTKNLNYAYLAFRLIEGLLMIVGGLVILSPVLQNKREVIYNDIHIYFFILGALFFYVLLYRTLIVPKFISIWGIIATILLLAITIIKLFGLESPIFSVFLAPIVLNEFFLAGWLIAKGFKIENGK